MKKYASQANISRMWSKIKTLISTKANDNNVVKLDGTTPMQIGNPHGGMQFYYNLINNLFYKAASKWHVTYTLTYADGTESTPNYSNVIFEYNYDNYIPIPAGGSLKITLTFDTDESKTYNDHKCFPGYPYGFYYLSFYSQHVPDSITARAYDVYLDSAGKWFNLPVSRLKNSEVNEVFSVKNNSCYGLTTLEFTINAKSDTSCSLTQLEFYGTRPYTAVIQNRALEAKTADNATAATFADTATAAGKLQTPRTINVSGAATGTASSFDGSADISIPINSLKEAYMSWGGKDISGSFSPLDAALIQELSANRLAGINNARVTLEQSGDGGETWVTVETTTGRDLCTKESNEFKNANTTSSQSVDNIYRVTVNVGGCLYCELRKIAMNFSTNGATGVTCTLETGDYSDTTVWSTVRTVNISGWTGWNIINTYLIIGRQSNGNIKYIRLTFKQASINSSYASNSILYSLRFYSANMWDVPTNLARYGVPYTIDSNMRTVFANPVKAPDGFIGNLTGTSSAVSLIQLTNSGRTISGLQGQLDTWLSNNAINKTAVCCFYASNSWVEAWNSGDTSSTYSAGSQWTVQNVSVYSSNTYVQLMIANYTDKYVYFVTKFNGAWKPVQKVIFKSDTATISSNGLMTAAMVKKLNGIDEGANKTVVDEALDSESTNSVQNKTVKKALDDKLDKIANAVSATKLTTKKYIDGMPFDGSLNVSRYFTCSTEAATAEKVTMVGDPTIDSNVTLISGLKITVKFTNANTAANPTLNLTVNNSKGVKPIYWHGAALTSAQYWEAGAVLDFIYDGTNWNLIGVAKDNNTTYSAATASANGLMTAAMVTKLNGIEEGANKTTVDGIPISGSTNAIQSGWIYTNWQTKADKATSLSGYGITDAYTKAQTDSAIGNMFGLIGNKKYTASGWMPNTSQTIGLSSGITAGTGAVLFEKSGGTDYTGTFTVKTDGIDTSCEYSGIKPGEIKMVKFNSMPVFAYKASESSASCAFNITLLYPPSS